MREITPRKMKDGDFGTLPAGFAGGFDADLDQDVFGGAVLSTVVGCHRQLVHVLFAVAQPLCVLDKPWESTHTKKWNGS